MRILALPLALLAFHGTIHPVSAPLRAQLVSAGMWHAGCPVSFAQLRLLTVSYWGFDRRVHQGGRLVVNASAAAPLRRVFRRLYALRFPIRRMDPVNLNGDVTASFECRNAAPSPCPGSGPTGHWSEHAYGEAVDLNPRENPYTGCGRTRDPTSVPYLDRSRARPGMATATVVAAFRSIGWGWGGAWSGTKDYMHFSANGH
jgi:D-alanyl-D-alanine carboxypeptidase-like protein